MPIDISKYTDFWFENASLDELESEREYVRVEGFLKSDFDTHDTFYDLLHKFDDYIRVKRYGDNDDWTGPVHTKHGWYLPDDD